MGEDRAMGDAAPKDNSMEEILASIRRIISSDSEEGAAPQTPPEPAKGKPVQPAAESKAATAAADTPPASPQEGHTPIQPAAGQEAGSGTFAGLAQQLRGTKGLEGEAKADGHESAPGASQNETTDVKAASATAAEKPDSKVAETTSDAASDSGARSLADLAKSINRKIDAVATKDVEASAASKQTPESGGDKAAQGDEPRLENTGPNPASAGSLSELAQSLQARAQGTAAQPATPEGNAEEASNNGVSGAKPPQAALTAPKTTNAATGDGLTEEADETAESGQSASKAPKAAVLASNLAQMGGDKPEEFREALVSPSTQQAVSGSMDRLKQAVSGLDQARVEAVLRPLLREWLDDNLPRLVERMVQQEIDRIVDDAGESGADQSPQDAPQQAKSA